MFNLFNMLIILISVFFLVILILNNKFKSKIIQYGFLIYSLIFLVMILLFDLNFVYDFFKEIVTYIWYPPYILFVITILFSIIIFAHTIVSKNKNIVTKIINYIIFLISFISYNIYNQLNIDPSIYSEYYKESNMILIRITTISFFIWFLLNIFIKIRGKYDK